MVDAKAKAEREAEARRALLGGKSREEAMAAFIARGNPDAAASVPEPVAPAPTQLVTEAATVVTGAPDPQPISEGAGEGADAPADAVVAASPAKAVRAAKKAPAATPWADAHPRVAINFSTKFPEELHMQMTWLTNNVPKLSIQKIVQEGTAAYVAKLLKEHYKP